VFTYATGDAPTAAAASLRYEKIADFDPLSDTIDLQIAPLLGAAETMSATLGRSAGNVSIDEAGRVTFSGSNVSSASMEELIAAVRSIVTQDGEIAFFEFDDGVNGIGTFIYQENGTSANDMLIFLSGVTGLVDFSGTLQDVDTFRLG
jgi:ABC-type hemin transport system ATPase subunit